MAEFPIIGIGASAGGIDALHSLVQLHGGRLRQDLFERTPG
jgi:chemotaxis response regulator CheB